MPIELQAIANHVWQSTVFAAAVGLLVIVCRRFGPRVRYGFWIAASAKFLVPFSILSTAGRWFGQRAEVPIAAPLSFAIEQINEPFSNELLISTIVPPRLATHPVDYWTSMTIWGLGAIWAVGAACMVVRWMRGLRQLRAVVGVAACVGRRGTREVLSGDSGTQCYRRLPSPDPLARRH
jgi:hypothetical protein